MKLAIVGSRTFTDYTKLKQVVYRYFLEKTENDKDIFFFDEIVSGGAIGVDQMGERLAKENDIKTDIIYPDYEKYGRYQAPLIRNEEIIKKADIVLAFSQNNSRGTNNAIEHAKTHKKDIIIIYV